MTEFGRWLERELTRTGRTRSDLARETGVTHPSATRWVNGDTQPTVENVTKICRILNADEEMVYRLLGWLPPQDYQFPPPIQRVARMLSRLSDSQVGMIEQMVQAVLRQQEDEKGH